MKLTIIGLILCLGLGCGKKGDNVKPGTVLWEFEAGDTVHSSPAIGSDGTVYIGGGEWFGKKLYAINSKTGVKLWEFEMRFPVYHSPAIASDGTVYVGPNGNKLYAINGKTGVKLWDFETGDGVVSDPAIGFDGTVYVGSLDGKLYAIKTDSKGLANSPWPMFGQNPQQTSRAPGAKATVALPPGKTLAWTVGINQKSIDRIYPGKTQAVIQQVFGKPDKTQGQFWGYTGMNLTDGQGNRYGTVWFGFTDGTVQQVLFDK